MEVPWLDTAVEIKKVFSLKDGKLCLGGETVTDTELVNLKSEAELLEKMKLWQVLQETVRSHAISTGFNNSTSFEHLLTAKAMIVLLDWQREWTRAVKTASFIDKKV